MSAFGVVGENGHCWVTLGVLHQEKTGWCFMPMNASIFVREKDVEVFKTKHDMALDEGCFSGQWYLLGEGIWAYPNKYQKP